MLRFKSLTSKFIFISIIMLIFIALYITQGYIFTHEMEGEARRINLAGREMMLTIGKNNAVLRQKHDILIKNQ